MRRLLQLLHTYWLSFGAYLMVGGTAALVEWGVFYLAFRYGRINYLAAAVAAFFVATFVNYLLSIRVSFRSRAGRSRGAEMGLIYAVSAVGLLVNLAVTAFGIEVLHVWVILAKVAGTGVAFIWNFAGRQFFVFERAPRWRANPTNRSDVKSPAQAE